MQDGKLTRRQLKKIWARARELDLLEGALRDLVEKVSGQRSIKALTFSQAAQVIDRMEVEKPSRERILGVESFPANVYGLPAPGHLAKIQELQKELGWNDEKLDAWLRKYFKTNFRGLDYLKAKGAFLALMSIKKRKN